jgi:hypothetical protein
LLAPQNGTETCRPGAVELDRNDMIFEGQDFTAVLLGDDWRDAHER